MNNSDNKFLVWGYKAAILLSFLGMIGSALYLFTFQLSSKGATDFDDYISLLGLTANMQMRLLSTAIFVGMSFGFLGFALFLIQAKGSVDIDASTENHKLKITQLSPGLFVILCATIIIVLASTYKIQFSMESSDPVEIGADPETETGPARQKYEIDDSTEREGIPPKKAPADTTKRKGKSTIV